MNAPTSRQADAPARPPSLPSALDLRDLAVRFDGASLVWLLVGTVAWVTVLHVGAAGRHFIAAHARGRRYDVAPFGQSLRADGEPRMEHEILERLVVTWPPPSLQTFHASDLRSWLDDVPPRVDVVVVAGVTVPVAALAVSLRTLDVDGRVYADRVEFRELPRVVSRAHVHLVLRGAGWAVVIEEVSPDPKAPVFRTLPHLAACETCGAEIATAHTPAETAARAIQRDVRIESRGAAGIVYTCATCAREPAPTCAPVPRPHDCAALSWGTARAEVTP